MITHSVIQRFGRLVVSRLVAPVTLGGAQEFHGRLLGTVDAVGVKAIVSWDLRRVGRIAPDVLDQLAATARSANAKTEQTALLVPGERGAELGRLVQTAGAASRRAFTTPEELIAWLSEPLSSMEQQRLREFLRGRAP